MSDENIGRNRREGEVPPEMEAVKTTIVGGRPPGCGRRLGEIPRGIEVLVKKAVVDPRFRAVLFEKRAAAAAEIDLTLTPSETMVLNSVPREQLEAIIARTKVDARTLPAFLGKAAGVMLAALGAAAVVSNADQGGSRGVRPDAPPPAPVMPVAGAAVAPRTQPVARPATGPAQTQPTQPSTQPATSPGTRPAPTQPASQATVELTPAQFTEIRITVRAGATAKKAVYVLHGQAADGVVPAAREFDDARKLLEALKQQKSKSVSVTIATAVDASADRATELFEQLKKEGFDNISYATEQPRPPDTVRPVRGITVLGVLR